MGMKTACQRIVNGYVHFMEKQGFALTAVICVAVITATAVWTDRREGSYVSPTPPVQEDVSAAQLLQQSLRQASAATPAPTATPRIFTPPLDDMNILHPFSLTAMVKSGVTGIWSIHDAVDLSAGRGSKVYAIADGIVADCGKNDLLGAWLLIDHGDGMEALYSGMALSAAYITGDKVHGGDVIGFVGDGPLEETDLGPHLHLKITRNGQAFDPTALF